MNELLVKPTQETRLWAVNAADVYLAGRTIDQQHDRSILAPSNPRPIAKLQVEVTAGSITFRLHRTIL
jgi:hypothetical protein